MKDLFYVGEFASLLFLFGASQAALITGISVILFPELAAIAYGVLSKPRSGWANQPILLIVTPTLAAGVGVVVERYWGYSPFSVTLSIALALLIIFVLRSPIVPAIAAGYLPVILGENSWLYPLAVLGTISLLVLLLIIIRKLHLIQNSKEINYSSKELSQIDQKGLISFLLFVFFIQIMVYFSGLKFILFPPLVVVSYEILTKPDHCPWGSQLFQLLILTLVMVTMGIVSLHLFGNTSLAVLLTVIIGIFLCRFLKIFLPPAMAMGLLPFVAPHPDMKLLISIALGMILFIVYYAFHNNYLKRLH